MRRTLLLLLAAASVVTAGCIPPEPDDDVIVNYDPEETVMGQIQERGHLSIGVPVDRPPFDELAAGLGGLVADALGVEAKLVPLPSGRILTAPEEGRVDVSFPVLTMTERLVRRYAFTDPFYLAHQRLLVTPDSPIEEVSDIDGIVCQYIDVRTGVNLKTLNPKLRPIAPPDPNTCADDLEAGRIEAIAAADWLLLPLLVENPQLRIVGDDHTTEAYGAVVETGASAWTDFVEGVLGEADAEGDWQRFYDAAFGPYVDEEVTHPDMTGEEAAALYPSDV